MFRIYFITFFSLIASLNTLNLFAEKNVKEVESVSTNIFNWEYADPNFERSLYWKEVDGNDSENLYKKISSHYIKIINTF